MIILGLNHDMYISSAALIRDGEIIAAAAEERFTRQKRTRAFPSNAIRYCLGEAGISIDQVDHLVTSWNPGVYMQKFNPIVSSHRRFKSEYLYSVPDNWMNMHPAPQRQVDHVQQRLVTPFGERNVWYVTHHRAHAANAFLMSPFEEAAIMTADSQGELESTTFGMGRGNNITIDRTILHPHSLGALYATFTEYLGFAPNSDEWKVMALAAMATTENRFDAILRERLVALTPDGGFRLNLDYFKDYLHELPNHYTAAFVDLFGPPRGKDDPLEERHFQITGALQRTVEWLVFSMLTHLHQRTGAENLCVAGGFFMNSVLNGRILSNTPFKRLFVSSCPDDSGNSLGAAYYLHNVILGQTTRAPIRHNYLGPAFSDDEIAATIGKCRLIAERSTNVEADTAKMLAEGQLVGWFQGRMELGQRALGNRSILADPRSETAKDKVNLAVKYREAFRPFAPAILAEDVTDYFDLEPGVTVPFMERVYPIRAEKRGAIPAVVHNDGTGRLQTVSADTNPRFHKLISEFKAITGVPVLLNTSFNLNGEPVVCSPVDAIRTFYSCGLDALVLGNHILRKPLSS